MTTLQILTEALEARNQEVLGYQINVDNYTRMIEKIGSNYADNDDLVAYASEIEQRLEEEKRQQLRAIIIRDIIQDQVEELTP